MPEQARVTSVEALVAFKARLITYHEQARATVEEVSGEVLRTRFWLQDDRRAHWEGEVRRRMKQFDEAKQALYNVELAHLRAPSAAEQMVVRKAKAALDEAESKLGLVKRWSRDFDGLVVPVAGRLNRLETFLAKSLPEAIGKLNKMTRALEAYRDVAPPAGAASELKTSPPAAAEETSDPAPQSSAGSPETKTR